MVTKKKTAKPFICSHSNMVPYEYIFGKRYKTEPYNTENFDWSSVVMGAHIMRVRTYYCPVCKEMITIDPRNKDATNPKTDAGS